MDTNPNNIEFSAKKKTDAKIIFMRIGIIAVCLVLFLILTLFFLKLFFVAIPVVFLAFAYAAWFFMRFTQIEYEYTIIGGEFSVSAIYNNMQRKTLIAAKIRDMNAVVPFEDGGEYIGGSSGSVLKVFYYCSDLKPENKDLYICVFQNPKHGRCAVVFNTSKKFIQIMRFYNSQNVILKNNFLI